MLAGAVKGTAARLAAVTAAAAAASTPMFLNVAECRDDKDGGKSAAAPSFDPEALERGAKALREINASPYAKKVREWAAIDAPARVNRSDRNPPSKWTSYGSTHSLERRLSIILLFFLSPNGR